MLKEWHNNSNLEEITKVSKRKLNKRDLNIRLEKSNIDPWALDMANNSKRRSLQRKERRQEPRNNNQRDKIMSKNNNILKIMNYTTLKVKRTCKLTYKRETSNPKSWKLSSIKKLWKSNKCKNMLNNSKKCKAKKETANKDHNKRSNTTTILKRWLSKNK